MRGRHTLQRRVGQRRAAQQGLTILELLLSVTLLVLITGFLAGGLQLARRAFEADRRATADLEAHNAINALVNQIASAFPLTDNSSGKLHFDGRSNELMFVSLDQGRASAAGLKHVVIRHAGTNLGIALTSPSQSEVDTASKATPIILLDRVADIRFSYFGAGSHKTAAAWRSDWSGMNQLPDLVSVRLEWKEAAPPTTVLVALRQRG